LPAAGPPRHDESAASSRSGPDCAPPSASRSSAGMVRLARLSRWAAGTTTQTGTGSPRGWDMSPGTTLTGWDFVALIVPVVLVLFTWIAGVLWADTHPNVRRTVPQAAGYEHSSYARTDDDALAAESSPAMSAADEEPAAATAAAGARPATAGPAASP